MDTANLSKANQAYINNSVQQKNATTPIKSTQTSVEDGENKMNKVLLGLSILGAAGIAVACAIRGKKQKTLDTQEIKKLVKQFQDIDFNKGTAKLKDGTLFTGTVEKVSENGDKLSMEYIDGVLQKSTKTTNGIEVVKEYTDGIILKKNGQTVDIKKVQDEVKIEQTKLKQLLANQDLSSEEFQKQADEIKFKSNNNEAEIKKIYNTKVETEKAAREEAERLAKEAQEKAEKLVKEQAIKVIAPKSYNIDEMSFEELQEYEIQLTRELDNIRKKYNSFAIPKDYLEEDYNKHLELTRKKTSVTEKMEKIAQAKKFDTLAEKINLTTNAKIRNLQTGEDINVTIAKIKPLNGGDYRVQVKNGEEILGLAEVCAPQKDIFVCSLPDDYAQNALELKFLSSSPKVKGAGTEIINQIIEDSKKLGYKGRVWLDACGGSLPRSMACLAGDKYKTSPVPFYYKLGFRFKDEELNKLAKQGIENIQNGLSYNGPQSGIMFLP